MRSAPTEPYQIPDYVSGDMRTAYEWSAVSPGKEILEAMPCFCGCKYEGHLHTRHCFWTDEGKFDKHGITCSTCLDIALKAKAMTEQGKGVCEIRKAIDDFYEPSAHLSTPTPLPEGCPQGS